MTRIAIVGGGPGGLFAAHFLKRLRIPAGDVCLFESATRLGGKVVTSQFDDGTAFEAGVAELYDYSVSGPDPLRQLVESLGLSTRPLRGGTVLLDGHILRGNADIRRTFGAVTADAIDTFRRRATELLSPAEYYDSHWQRDNAHPWAGRPLDAILHEIPDDVARRYLWVAAKSDVATEPHLTSALNGLKNFLMDDPRYLGLYTVDGGLERFTRALAAPLDMDVRLGAPVNAITATADGRYSVQIDAAPAEIFDYVIVALPVPWLRRITWGGAELAAAMERHCTRYHAPGHYLRVTVRFKEAFWRKHVQDSYFMLDAFGGCCVYDQSPDSGNPGVLGWLIAGADAESLSAEPDDALITRALASLPRGIGDARAAFLDARVHRWLDSVSGMPGGSPAAEPEGQHVPEPLHHPGLLLVGDYLFDSTLNGTLDSAEIATDILATRIARQNGVVPSPDAGSEVYAVDASYHDEYAGDLSYEESYEEYFDAGYTRDMIRIAWGAEPPYRLLDCGSANGLTLGAFAEVGIDAWGVENSAHIHQRTPKEWRARNLLGDVRHLPFPDGHFDFVYETCLCYVAEADLDRAIRELRRVTRRGVFFGGITTDMTPAVIEKHDLFFGVNTLATLREWSERFLRNGFSFALTRPDALAAAWRCETDANEGDDPWYPSPESLKFCFYSADR